MAGIKEVATAAGVSVSTVSLVVNNKPGISEATRKKVFQAMQEVGYQMPYSLLGNGKRKNSLRSIQLILYKKHGNVVSDTPFFAKLLEGVEMEAKKRGFGLLISYINEGEIIEQLQNCLSSGSEGIILLATEMSDKDLAPFVHAGVPCVILDSYFQEISMDTIVINNTQGAYLATRYLGQKGHKKIGYLQSNVFINNFEERKHGYLTALRDMEISYDERLIFPIGSSVETAYADMKKLLNQNPILPTAFFADNDIIAIGAIKALKELGISIPEDVSVVGFDDMPMCEVFDPPLTTVYVPKQYMGMMAVERLMSRMEGMTDMTVKVEINTKLIVRQSVKELY